MAKTPEVEPAWTARRLLPNGDEHVVSWRERGWSCSCGAAQGASTTVVARALALWHLKDPSHGVPR